MQNICAPVLTTSERDELIRAIILLNDANPTIAELLPAIPSALSKLAAAAEGPTITVGVHGGQVQWILGNSFPIRVCDYDGTDAELSDVDERNQRCRIWFEPIDVNWSQAVWK